MDNRSKSKPIMFYSHARDIAMPDYLTAPDGRVFGIRRWQPDVTMKGPLTAVVEVTIERVELEYKPVESGPWVPGDRISLSDVNAVIEQQQRKPYVPAGTKDLGNPPPSVGS